MSHDKAATISEAQEATVRPHQPGEAVFKSILPEDVDWKPFPAFPPSVRLAVIVGQPSEQREEVVSPMYERFALMPCRGRAKGYRP